MKITCKKDLEILLESVPTYSNPKAYLEQYVTPSPLAAEILWYAFLKGDIKGKIVVDLGSGTGRLAYGAALLGAKYVIGIDVDVEAIYDLRRCKLWDLTGSYIDVVNSDVSYLNISDHVRDIITVVQNPPFGVYERGRDIAFLKTSLSIGNTVYSIHKYVPESIKLISEIAEESGYHVEIPQILNFPIRWSLPKHRRKVYYVKTVLVRLRKSPGNIKK